MEQALIVAEAVKHKWLNKVVKQRADVAFSVLGFCAAGRSLVANPEAPCKLNGAGAAILSAEAPGPPLLLLIMTLFGYNLFTNIWPP